MNFDQVHRAFNEAFSDYVVKMSLSAEQLREMLTRRGWAPEASAAVYADGQIAAFALNCIDGERAYNSGTGVVPRHRRSGFGRQVMEESFRLLRGKRYVLEVIETNTPAVELYRSLGFHEERRLQCWTYVSPHGAPPPPAAHAAEGRGAPLKPAYFDISPSWQNEMVSIQRAKAPSITVGDDRGFAVVFPSTGDLPLLAVRRDARRQGVGRGLLEAAAAHAGKPLRILNVDERDPGIAAFLEACGARRTVRQIEMSRQL